MILIILTYLAGVLTILSPCILPVLPFVFSRAQHSFLKSGVPLLGGMCFTFSLFSVLAIVGGEWIGQANEVGRIVAMVLLSIFGASLIFPHLTEKMLTPLTRVGSKIGGSSKENGAGGSFLVGVSTGLLWAPCAGPILGLVLTGAASQKNVGTSVVLLIAYSLGAATSLALALVAGNKFLGTLKKFLGVDQVIKKGLGVAVLLGVLAIAFNLDRTFLTKISKIETASFENKLLTLAGPKNQKEEVFEGDLPELNGASSWINSKPLTKNDLLGKVVLIDFWTYSCINCLRTLPYVKAWAEKYKDDGLVVIGVHTPEFAFEKSVANVQAAVKDLGITYPVAIDSQYEIWNAFQNKYWPAHYFIDRQGHIRDHHFGEGKYEESEQIIRSLLAENGNSIHPEKAVIQAQGVQASSSNEVKSPETYLGYARAENFTSATPVRNDKATIYSFSKQLKINQWSLQGKWLISREKIILKDFHGKIKFNFNGRDLHLVLGSKSTVKFKVTLDGQPLGESHGVDTDKDGFGEIKSQRLYQLIRLKNAPFTNHTFEIEFLDLNVEAYAFTFG